MKPRGIHPACLTALDSCIFGAQVTADGIHDYAIDLMRDLTDFWRDREITVSELKHLSSDIQRLHTATDQECSLLDSARGLVNGVSTLVEGYRLKLQGGK